MLFSHANIHKTKFGTVKTNSGRSIPTKPLENRTYLEDYNRNVALSDFK